MSIPRTFIAAGAAIGTLAGCAMNQPVSTPGVVDSGYALAIERSRNIVAPLVRRGSGVAVAVGVDGKLVWSEGFGRLALDDGAGPVRPDTPFRVYSLIKQVTAVLALQAALRDEVNLQESIRREMPSLPAHLEEVTLQQLLTHTGGIRHYRDPAEARMTKPCTTAAQALPRFVQDSLVATPGERMSYSTWGFVLASAVLEHAAGLPFDSLMATRIFRPAGMTTAVLEHVSAEGGPAYYDVTADGETVPAPPVDNSCKMGGGGFVASAEDMVRFHDAVLTGALIPLEATRQLLGGRSRLLAGGSGPGGEAVSIVDLDRRVSVIILSNTSGLEQRMALERARGLVAAMF